MTEIKFYYKDYKGLRRAVIEGKFLHREKASRETLIVDTGADFTTVSMALAEELGINPKNEINEQLKHEWENWGKKSSIAFIHQHWKDAKDKSFPTETVCACGDSTKGYFYLIDLELEDHCFQIPVIFTEASTMPLLGRKGLYQRLSSINLDLENNEGKFIAKENPLEDSLS